MDKRGFLLIPFLLIGLAACGPRTAAHQCIASTSVGEHVLIAGGTIDRGPHQFAPEETVGGRGKVSAFTIDKTEVTNAQFAAFVAATHYVTLAERLGSNGENIGAAVFSPGTGLWRIDAAANWRHPAGADSSIEGRDSDAVVDVAFGDAEAYAAWLHRRLPTELEWEFAARGSDAAPEQPKAETVSRDGHYLANTWQGPFPFKDSGADGFKGVAPVGCFPPNKNGLYDMIGNVWEWTSDWYGRDQAPADQAAAREADPEKLARHVLKGGSYLCSDSFCARYRSGARQPGDPELGMSHVGFRTVGNP